MRGACVTSMCARTPVPWNLTECIVRTRGYGTITHPTVSTGDGATYPHARLELRYLTEGVPMLRMLQHVARMCVPTPHMDTIIQWADRAGDDDAATYRGASSHPPPSVVVRRRQRRQPGPARLLREDAGGCWRA